MLYGVSHQAFHAHSLFNQVSAVAALTDMRDQPHVRFDPEFTIHECVSEFVHHAAGEPICRDDAHVSLPVSRRTCRNEIHAGRELFPMSAQRWRWRIRRKVNWRRSHQRIFNGRAIAVIALPSDSRTTSLTV